MDGLVQAKVTCLIVSYTQSLLTCFPFYIDQPLEWREFQLKAFEDDDIEMDITHCGICGSDIHTLDSGWGPTDYPCVVGHEVKYTKQRQKL